MSKLIGYSTGQDGIHQSETNKHSNWLKSIVNDWNLLGGTGLLCLSSLATVLGRMEYISLKQTSILIG